MRTVETPFGTLAGVICWDVDYPQAIRQASPKNVAILLAPSNDWPEITLMHTDMAVYRAIENGFSLVRQTDHGLSVAYDPYGRILAQMDHFAASQRVMVAQGRKLKS